MYHFFEPPIKNSVFCFLYKMERIDIFSIPYYHNLNFLQYHHSMLQCSLADFHLIYTFGKIQLNQNKFVCIKYDQLVLVNHVNEYWFHIQDYILQKGYFVLPLPLFGYLQLVYSNQIQMCI